MKDRKQLFSTLWVCAVLNYLYCDVMSLMDANLLRQYLTGTVEGIHMTQGLFLGAAVLMEVSISMVLLSRLLPYRANRFANIGAGALTTVVQAATLIGTPTMYYIFFSVVEIGCTLAIFVLALRWKENAEQPRTEVA
jgi:hypothetical protein